MAREFFSKTKLPDSIKNGDIITIIGCGIVGAAIAYELSKQAEERDLHININVLDQAKEVPNPLGSSYGSARITRMATAEGEEYIPYAIGSQEIIKELEAKTGKKLHIHSGGLIIGPDTADSWPRLSNNFAKKSGIDSELKNKSQLENYGALKIKETEIAYSEKTMGMLLPKECHEALITLAKKQGVNFFFGEKYTGFDEKPQTNSMIVHTESGKDYPTNKLILSMGPWIQEELAKQLKQDISEQLSVHACTMYTFKVEPNKLEKYKPENCPVLIWQIDKTEAFVFFPDVTGSGTVQFAIFPVTDLHSSVLTPEEIKKQPALMAPEKVYEKYIRPHFDGISAECQSTTNYPFTMNKKERFIYAELPGHPNVRIVDFGSGHGYKHAFEGGKQVAKDILTNGIGNEIEKTFGTFFEDLKEIQNVTLKSKPVSKL